MELFYTGKTVEEATAKALEQLGIEREEISIEVVEMPVRKLFRSIPAKIRVTLLAEEAENARKAEAEAAAKAAAEKKAAEKKAAEKAAAEKKAAEKKAAEKAAAEKKAAEKAEKTEKAEKKPEPKKPVEKKAEPAVEAAPAETAPEAAEAAPVKEPKEFNPEKIELAKVFLETVAADMGVTGFTVTPEQQDETLVLKVEGEGLGILIGRRGETMEALSYLTGLVANRLGGDYQKVALDVAGYRSKRESDLVALAKRVGAKVAKTGRSYTMEPMNPYERRIIHSTISKMEGVSSESTGEGEDRRVVISSTDPNAVNTSARSSNRSRGGKGRGKGGSGEGRNENRGEGRSNGNRGN
ncbi:MAG: Jag N-terminal domain-containing protein, partial [Oscillospiraceae bacterium]|nr:Jag N-terminal domain-containing protein [Oscillospiraceae bacterium]